MKSNELKTPVQLSFTIDINRDYNGAGDLVFENGNIVFDRVRIVGEREEGTDIDFVRQFPDGFMVDLSTVTPLPELDFDLPKGAYKRLELEFYVKNMAQSTAPSLTVEGLYTKSSQNETFGVLFEADSAKLFTIRVENDVQGNEISLMQKEHVVEVTLDPLEWFKPVLAQTFNGASIRSIDNKSTIPVNKTENVNIFGVVVKRINKGNSAILY